MPEEAQSVPDEPTVRFYADGYEFDAHQYTIFLTLTASRPKKGASQTEAVVHMSPEHAKVMAILFKRSMKQFEEQLGIEIPIPEAVLKTHKIDLSEEW